MQRPLHTARAHAQPVPLLSLAVLRLACQVLLYQLMPGPKDRGQPTPAGYTLKYVVNGWNCWWATHIAVLALLYCVTGFRAATIVTRNWIGIFWVSAHSRSR